MHIYLAYISTKTNADYSQLSSLTEKCLHSGISKAASNSWPPTEMKYSHVPAFSILESTPPTSQFERLIIFPSKSTNNQVIGSTVCLSQVQYVQ